VHVQQLLFLLDKIKYHFESVNMYHKHSMYCIQSSLECSLIKYEEIRKKLKNSNVISAVGSKGM
jgi:hypothetical protein